MPTHSILKNLAKPSDLQVMQSIDGRLSLESFAVKNLAHSVSEVVPKLTGAAKSFFTGLLEQMPKFSGASLLSDVQTSDVLLKKLKTQDYANLLKLGIYVPEGFHGNLADYSLALRKSTDHALGVVTSVITPYNSFLSSLISSPDAVKDSHNTLGYLDKVNKERDELNAHIGQFFHPGSTQTRIPLGDAVRRMAEWEIIFTQQTAIEHAFEQVRNTQVQQAVNAAMDLLDAVKEAAASGQFDHISSENLKGLSASTLSIAREVEFYAITRQRVTVFNVALMDSCKFLQTLF